MPRTMDSCVSETISKAYDDFTARDKFLGNHRSLRPSDRDEVDSESDSEAKALDHAVWSKLPEELLIHIFARLPVTNILRIRCLSKSWRSAITSPQFQQAFSEASLVRISLLALINHCDSIFFSQENREESYRPSYNPHSSEKLFEDSLDIAGTASGLICVIKYQRGEPGLSHRIILEVQVFVMNMVTGIHRELPSPRITTLRPTLVQMKANVNGGYTITFIYTKDREEFEVTSWQVYDSIENAWSNDEGRAIADFKDVEAFNTFSYYYQHYDVPATFHKQTKAISVFNLHEGKERCDPWVYPSNPNGHVHNVSGELYKLCTREGRHGVWRRLCSSKWEMVCECPDLEGLWTCLRVMNDLVVLIIELPVHYELMEWYDELIRGKGYKFLHGGIVKVFHMPSKTWHSFPEDEHFTTCFGFCMQHCLFDQYLVLVEIQFDSIP